MKKRKTYEISVIDKTYSKTISDETKFYTSDTALELGFELKETDYNFESAEIVLLNIDDRSLVTRPVTKGLNGFTYELDEDIISHYGEWHGQLRFEAGEIYVSSPVKFRIENDLSNDRPPQLSDVQSWVSLKRYADSLTEELKQAVLDVGGIGDTFNENETDRQNQFTSAEQSRQTTFETNESERTETFNINEDIRQTQELEREKAESQRQTTFDDNEANRTNTFNTNEANRTNTFNTNEATRQENEEARELAENERENAEAQRKTDHANRSSELAGKADKVVLENLVENGDFKDGLTGWNHSYSQTATVSNNVLTSVIDTNNRSAIAIVAQNTGVPVSTGDRVYVLIRSRVTNSECTSLAHYFNGSNTEFTSNAQVITNILNPVINTWYLTQEIITIPPVVTGSMRVALRHMYSKWGAPSIGNAMEVSEVQAINLTQTFSAGNEPTKEEMDELLKITGYIDGEYALNNKEMLIWTLALIRRNKNAIITLGGTV